MRTYDIPAWARAGTAALLLAAIVPHGSAAPALQWNTVTNAPGTTARIELRLTGGTQPYAGFNGIVYLPLFAQVSTVERGTLTADSAFVLSHNALNDGSGGVALLCYADNSTFQGSGTLCILNLEIPDTAEPGAYPVVMDSPSRTAPVRDSHALSNDSGTHAPAHAVVDGRLVVAFPASPTDLNGNGIADAWEDQYFGGPTNVTHLTDSDGDGLSDYYEFRSGTDPLDTSSCVRITGLLPRDDTDGGGVQLHWYAIPGRGYRVERADALTGGDIFYPVGDTTPATDPHRRFSDATPRATRPRFYRVLLLP